MRLKNIFNVKTIVVGFSKRKLSVDDVFVANYASKLSNLHHYCPDAYAFLISRCRQSDRTNTVLKIDQENDGAHIHTLGVYGVFNPYQTSIDPLISRAILKAAEMPIAKAKETLDLFSAINPPPVNVENNSETVVVGNIDAVGIQMGFDLTPKK